MRGKLWRNQPELRRQGTIPAHAGETRAGSARMASMWDHPRACGGNAATSSIFCGGRGPSPRMRGKRCAPHRQRGRAGTIPAHAGETRTRAAGGPLQGDHPRACGGNLIPGGQPEPSGGPSPRMRGKHETDVKQVDNAGTIPAHAGETHVAAEEVLKIRDHPRACGGNNSSISLVASCSGPSPRMRGKL